ncbi:SAM-dependent methyltransferase [Microbacterium sp. SS28]|uniref:SAM-dependent methyltransferase n=1 Tax=Microbacterium sp. SS28 TaxID=2919948 RepID=UPI001FAA6069|nr:SAM-dependent methyltransferase [Microbacterium sp. SS28]
MTDIALVAADWLTLREAADARSRSRRLALAAARLVREPVVVHDLGSGTGSMMRWLAPLLPGRQTWVLHEADDDLLRQAARAPGFDAAGRPVRVETSVGRIDGLHVGSLAGASLVVGSALLDVLTRDEVETIAAVCVAAGAPTLLSLTVTGRVRLIPDDPGDRVFEAAFVDHQHRAIEDRTPLGPDAVAVAVASFRSRGWITRVAGSSWQLRSADSALTSEWLESWVGAAVDQRPALREWADEYLQTRRRQLAAGELRVAVHHADLLAFPP